MTVNKFNLYLGGPGTGKTFLLKKLASENPQSHIICPTWQSGNLVNGLTIYNYCGCACLGQFKPKPFRFPTVFIDEVFLFSNIDFQKILQCTEQSTTFHLFGDPFQLKAPTQNDYFYESITEKINKIELTTYYRSQTCPKLQTILRDYRLNKKIIVKNQFQKIQINQIKELLDKNATIIVGTHRAREKYLSYISQRFKKDLIYAIDGNQYRPNQRVFSISHFGAIQKKYRMIEQKDNKLFLQNEQNQIEQMEPYTKAGKTCFPLISAEVATINILQGQTLDTVIIDDSLFEYGSFYTAISRVKKIEDIYLLNYDKERIFETDLQNIYCK